MRPGQGEAGDDGIKHCERGRSCEDIFFQIDGKLWNLHKNNLGKWSLHRARVVPKIVYESLGDEPFHIEEVDT